MADELKLLSPQEFPPLLREISDPPKQLHLRGKMPSTDHKWLAVPGSGLDWNVLYPKANVGLAREILKAGGALLSEFKPEQKAADYTFPQRNRIMAGLSHATLVIEAKEKSGSLITAKLVTEYNRELLVVPGSI